MLLGIVVFNTYIYAETIKDQDLDGVPDTIDQCPDTPFFNEVNAYGCTTTILTLPEETESDSLIATLGYGLSNNEDLIDRKQQDTGKFQLSYYHDDWSYSLRTGYFKNSQESGMLDTTLKIKKKFKLTPSLKFGLGLGIKLPTYDFKGNETDYIFYSSLNYYPTSSLSLFTGINYTLINDDETDTPLQNTNSFYIGLGYFFTNNFYANFSYNYLKSKFTTEHASNTLSSTLYYKIDEKWFTTLSYSREIADDDLHDALNFKIGYKIW